MRLAYVVCLATEHTGSWDTVFCCFFKQQNTAVARWPLPLREGTCEYESLNIIYNILYSANISPKGVTYSPRSSEKTELWGAPLTQPASQGGVVVPVYLDKALNLNTALPERSWDTLSPLPRSLDS